MRRHVGAVCVASLVLLGVSVRSQNASDDQIHYCGALVPTDRMPTVGERARRAGFICKAMDQKAEEVRAEVAASGDGRQFLIFVAQVVPFADWDYYYVKGDSLSWHPNPGQSLPTVQVPEGFVTDLASIPRPFWAILPPQGRYAYAAVIHDYLYWTHLTTRQQADDILRTAMQDSKVDPTKIAIIYNAVRKFGGSAWAANARLRANGECRLLDLRFPPSLMDSWSQWKKNPRFFQEKNCRSR